MKENNPIEEYIKKHPIKVQKILQELRGEIKRYAPNSKEAMSYGVPAFKLNGDLVLYAAFKNHIGIYPTPSAIKHFKKELSEFETSKGTIKFPINKPLPYNLIKKIIEFRVKESSKK